MCVCLVAESYPTLCDPVDCSLPGFSVHGDSPGKNTGMGCHALLQGIFPTRWKGTGIKARSPALLVDSLLSEPPGKPMNTRVGSLSLLQGIFPTQESNQGLPHCRQILYQLSYQGSPYMCVYIYIQIMLLYTWNLNIIVNHLCFIFFKSLHKSLCTSVHRSLIHSAQKSRNNPNVHQLMNG